ncbi:MAG: HNH endonuclease [Cyanobacteriota bacterium]|nr:HNH endonuclease [Cyanobacteriota bacterium]
MSTYIAETLKNKILNYDKRRCCYCLTTEANSVIPMSFDHIKPVSKGGKTTFDNLCLAFRSCNEFKSDIVEAVDPLSGETASIFNPCTQSWFDNCQWNPDSIKVEGLTAVGRATIVTLRMNNPVIVVARKRWTINNWHPPID